MSVKVIDDREPKSRTCFRDVPHGNWFEAAGEFLKRIQKSTDIHGNYTNACDADGDLFHVEYDIPVYPVDVEIHIVGAAT